MVLDTAVHAVGMVPLHREYHAHSSGPIRLP